MCSAETKTKKSSTLFSLRGTSVPFNKYGLPVGELRLLGKEVQAAHHLRGAARLIGDEWVVGIKCPTKKIASDSLAFLCFRWDGNFGSAITLTASQAIGSTGWVARAWLSSRHPAVAELRNSRSITVVSIYNGEPISVVKLFAKDESETGGLSIATDLSTENERRPNEILIELDEELAYWETFVLSNAWDKLLRVTDHLQIGWCKEFTDGLFLIAKIIRNGLIVPNLSDADWELWKDGGLNCPKEFWDSTVIPITNVLQGQTPLLQFVRTANFSDVLMSIADSDEVVRKLNPLDDIRWAVGYLVECLLLSDTQTAFGRKAVFCSLDKSQSEGVEIPTEHLDISDAKKYWENLPGVGTLNVANLVSASMQPAKLEEIIEQIKTIHLGCDVTDATTAITTMTEEANILNHWTIPWGARVQTSIGPFVEIDFFPYGDEISILLKTKNQQYRWAAFNLRNNAWNFVHLFRNRFKAFIDDNGKEKVLAEEIELAFKLVITSIVRDFIVLEERESVFAVRRDKSLRGKSTDDDNLRIIYIPRIQYIQSPDTKGLEASLEYESRRPHHVRAHPRRTDSASPYQRILAERYGFRLEPGFTFVRPHQRGGIAPDREVIYRSRSAMQSLFGVERSVESNGTSNWFQFERDVHDAMKELGYKVDHVASAKNGDDGVDVFAEDSKRNEFWAIQCKCYAPKRKIGPAVVRELIGALTGYPAGTRGMLVTTSGYSSGAVELASKSGIKLRLLVADIKKYGQRILIEPSEREKIKGVRGELFSAT